MEYNDDALPLLSNIEEMARAYNLSLKEKGFVFINLEEEGKNLLIEEVFDVLFKLRASYRYLGNFMASNNMLTMTEEHISKLRDCFDIEENKGFFVSTNRTKCFINSISLENQLLIKLLLLSQKSAYGEQILSIIIERAKHISQNLEVGNSFRKNMY